VQVNREREASAVELTDDQLRIQAANLLAARVAGSVQLHPREVVSDYAGAMNIVRRYAVTVDGQPHPQTVIIKSRHRLRELMAREAAGLAFLDGGEQLTGLAPRCYGLDRAAGILVLEDLQLAEEQRLGQILFASNRQAAHDALVAFMCTLGTMHAAGCQGQARYEALCAQYQVVGEARHPIATLLTDLGDLLPLFSHYEVTITPALSADLRAVSAALLSISPLQTFTHGDATPANAFITPDGVRLLDLEASGFRHALLDGAFARLRFIFSVWARAIPLPEQRMMERAYREAFAAGCPEVADDKIYRPALAVACAAWLAGLCARLPLVVEQDRRWGRSTWRQRIVAGLEQFVVVAEETRQLPELAEAAQQLAYRLRAQWPDEECCLPLYPAFERADGADPTPADRSHSGA